MKKKLVLLMSMLLSFGQFCSCSSDNDEEVHLDLYGSWSIIGYGNDLEFHTGDNIVNTSKLTFNPDGTFNGVIFPNDVFGKYECDGNNFSFTEIFSTKLGAVDPELKYIDYQLRIVKKYRILSGSELRLYYEEDNYIKFNKER